MTIKLRPHHSLCIQFFIGKGYSEDFIKNMTNVINCLETNDPVIQFTSDRDIICSCCPNLDNGICTSIDKVLQIDSRCLHTSGLEFNSKIRWSELKKTVYDKIISCGKLSAVCQDCCWHDICRSMI